MLTKTVEGIRLQKTIGKGYHRWVATIAGNKVVFSAKLGWRSKKPICWQGIYMPSSGQNDICGHGYSLALCVKNTVDFFAGEQT